MPTRPQRLLVSVRGSREALEAAKGGAHIADVEFPGSALGTPYPLNVKVVRDALPSRVLVSTNIGERQAVRATACQAALGIAAAGADLIKCGMAELNFAAAEYLGKSLVRTVKMWFPRKRVYPAIFPDQELRRFLDPLKEGPRLAINTKADGILIDTFRKDIGKGLIDYCSLKELRKFVSDCHCRDVEAWLAGSITLEELPDLWATGVDVICVRGAACARKKGAERFGEVTATHVAQLVATIPKGRNVGRREQRS
jgi:(5-formylfuran-3-yl)methyl phosphate synthase